MKKYLSTIIYSFFFLAVFSSCSGCKFSSDENDSSQLSSYTPDVQWSLETCTYGGTSRITQNGKYLYFVETYNYDSENATHSIAKVDLQNGTYVWKSSEFAKYTLDEPVVCGNYVFLEKKAEEGELPSSIYCFSDSDGTLLATITFGNSEREKHAKRISNWSLYPIENQYLIWSNGYIKSGYDDFDFGILKIDISKIDFSADPLEEQYICPETVLKLDRAIYTHFANDGEVVFYTTYSEFDDSPDCITGAVNAVTGEKLWSRESDDMRGNGFNGLYVLNDSEKKLTSRLYSFEYFIGCYSEDSGNKIWEKIQTADEIVNEVYLGGLNYNEGVFYSDGCFYYTTSEAASNSGIKRNQDVISNIKCIDAKSGKLKWSYMPENSASLFTRPIVANGKVFILTFGQGLYVFDKDSGTVLGVDSSIYTKGYEKNALYNGNVIFFDFANERVQGVLKAIKP